MAKGSHGFDQTLWLSCRHRLKAGGHRTDLYSWLFRVRCPLAGRSHNLTCEIDQSLTDLRCLWSMWFLQWTEQKTTKRWGRQLRHLQIGLHQDLDVCLQLATWLQNVNCSWNNIWPHFYFLGYLDVLTWCFRTSILWLIHFNSVWYVMEYKFNLSKDALMNRR